MKDEPRRPWLDWPARVECLLVLEGTAVRLFWDPNRERDLSGYRVFRQLDDGEWMRIGADPVEQPLYLDPDVGVGQRLRYRVTAIDRASPVNESVASDEVVVELGEEPVNGGLDP